MTMTTDITAHDALLRLGAATGESVAQVLEMFVPGQVVRGDVTVAPESESPFVNLPSDGVAASVRYVDGVTGANIFMMPAESAHKLAAAMGVEPDSEGATLSELELSAIGEAANQTLAAAAAAISVFIGHEVSISPPDVRLIDGNTDPIELWGSSAHACSTSFTVADAPCRLIQLVPSAFVVRVARAIDEQTEDSPAIPESLNSDGSAGGVPLDESLSGISLRMWAELGRAQMKLGTALALPQGAVIELDEPADNPVELYVNGLRLGTARLLVTDDGEWAVEITSLGDHEITRKEPH